MREIIEQRLIKFSVSIIDLCRNLNSEYVSQHLTNQIIRSATSCALNYGEAQGAESRKDFIHKTSVILKELRETNICLRIMNESSVLKKSSDVENVISESRELIAIFHKTIKTSRSRNSNS